MRVPSLIAISLLLVLHAYPQQVRLKLLEDHTWPAFQAAVEAQKRMDEQALNDNYKKVLIELNDFRNIYKTLSSEEQKKSLKKLLYLYHNAIIYCLESIELEMYKKPVQAYIDWGLELSKQEAGENGLLYGHFLSIAAYFYTEMHELDKVEKLHLQAIEIYKKQVGVSDIYYANEVARLAYYYFSCGELEMAEKRLLEIAPVFESHYKKEEDPNYLRYMYNILHVYLEMKNYKQVKIYADKLIPLFKKVNHIEDTTPITFFLAELSILAGSLEYAVDLQLDNLSGKMDSVRSNIENLQSVKIHMDPTHPLSQMILQNDPGLAEDLVALDFLREHGPNETSGQPDSSVQARINRIEEILERSKKLQGKYSDNSLHMTTILLDQHIGNPIKADYYLSQMLDIQKNQLRKRIGFQTEIERENSWKNGSIIRLYTKLLILRNYDNNHQLATHLHNLELLSKGMLLSSSQAIRNSIFASKNPATADLWHQLLTLKADEKNNEIEIEQIERKLIYASEKYMEQQEYLNIQWDDIKKSLKKDEIAIEFIDIPTDDGEYYIVSVIRPDSKYPSLYPICDKKDLIQVLADTDRSKSHQTLYEIIWKPFEHLLKGGKTLYISPVGLLHSVSFNGIKKGDHYLCDEYKIYNLLSTKDVIGLKKKKENLRKNKRIALFGGADYGLPADELSRLDQDLKTDITANLNRSMLDEMNPTRSQGFSYLAGSRKEVQTIAQQLITDSWRVSLRMDKQATETKFKSLSSNQSPKVIHISTHGFYFPEPLYDPMQIALVLLMGGQQNKYRLSENPLMRSGLAFTGANHVWKGGEPAKDTDDGILTALEVAQMNLSNTELVVLSACETGLGDLYGSEGVYGLQRAFKLAGVETMLVSLWKVPDKETMELMTEFYSLWASGLSKKEAFTQAQMKFRHAYPDHPEVWAGFIMIE